MTKFRKTNRSSHIKDSLTMAGKLWLMMILVIVAALTSGCIQGHGGSEYTENQEENGGLPKQSAYQENQEGSAYTENQEENGGLPRITWRLYTQFKKRTIEEVESIVGVNIPEPTYLPDSCEVKEVLASIGQNAACASVRFIISDREIIWHGDRDFECVVIVGIDWVRPPGSPGRKIPLTTPTVEPEYQRITCIHYDRELGEFEIVVTASKDFPKEELLEVMNSIEYCEGVGR